MMVFVIISKEILIWFGPSTLDSSTWTRWEMKVVQSQTPQQREPRSGPSIDHAAHHTSCDRNPHDLMSNHPTTCAVSHVAVFVYSLIHHHQ